MYKCFNIEWLAWLRDTPSLSWSRLRPDHCDGNGRHPVKYYSATVWQDILCVVVASYQSFRFGVTCTKVSDSNGLFCDRSRPASASLVIFVHFG